MLNTVSFTLEDGTAIALSHSALLIFLDETGHEELRDANFPIFGYGGCITFAQDYQSTIVQSWRALEHSLPHDILPLHASALPILRFTKQNFDDMNAFFSMNFFGRVAAVCSNTTINAQSELTTFQYMVGVIHNRIVRVLQRIVNEGRLFREIVMVIESSARTKALITQSFSQYAFQINEQTVPLSHYFMTKSANEPGLVVADFIAHTAGTMVRAKSQGRIQNYLERRDAIHIFTPQDSRWVDFLEVNTVQKTDPSPA